MPSDPLGQDILAILKLDGFTQATPDLYHATHREMARRQGASLMARLARSRELAAGLESALARGRPHGRNRGDDLASRAEPVGVGPGKQPSLADRRISRRSLRRRASTGDLACGRLGDIRRARSGAEPLQRSRCALCCSSSCRTTKFLPRPIPASSLFTAASQPISTSISRRADDLVIDNDAGRAWLSRTLRTEGFSVGRILVGDRHLRIAQGAARSISDAHSRQWRTDRRLRRLSDIWRSSACCSPWAS